MAILTAMPDPLPVRVGPPRFATHVILHTNWPSSNLCDTHVTFYSFTKLTANGTLLMGGIPSQRRNGFSAEPVQEYLFQKGRPYSVQSERAKLRERD